MENLESEIEMDDMGSEKDDPESLVHENKELVEKWLRRIDSSSKEEEKWRKVGQEISAVYTPKDAGKANSYNILYSNIDILLPTLYSNTPLPDVRRRFDEKDPVARFASKVIERILSYELHEYDFDYTMECLTLDTLLPGRGVARAKYVPIIEKRIDEFGNEFEEIISEAAMCEYVKWEDFRRSAGKVWDDVTWIAYRSYPDKETIAKEFGEDIADKLTYNIVANSSGEAEDKEKLEGESNRVVVWEIWDKISGEVIFIAESYKDAPLKRSEPGVKFKHFFDTPRPMQFILRTDSLIPMPEYQEYRVQAEQLVLISQRINNITKALKVRGVYDSTMKELEQLFDADDNDMLPAENVAAMYEKGGIDKMIWLLPIKDLAAALQYLYQQRESIKSIIFEISGVSDVLRGATRASETLGAQELKAQYGNTRLKRRQKEIQRYIRDLFRLKAEIIAENFQPTTLEKISGINPQELQMAQVSPDQILEILRNDTIRDYRIDVQSDSMVALEDKGAQEQTAAFLQAINQFFAMVTPLVQSGAIPMEAAKQILAIVSRKFKMGEEFESALDSMREPPKDDSEKKLKEAELAQEDRRIGIEEVNAKTNEQKALVDAASKVAEIVGGVE